MDRYGTPPTYPSFLPFRALDHISLGAFEIDHDLADAAAIAQIDEDQLAEIAAFLHPAAECDFLSDVACAQRPCRRA